MTALEIITVIASTIHIKDKWLQKMRLRIRLFYDLL